MAITPITNYMPVHNSGINFSGKNRKQEQYLEEYSRNSSPMSGLKKVPVIVLMAMSPANMQNIQANPLPETEPEMVTSMISAPPINEPQSIGGVEVVHDNPNGFPATYYFNKVDIDGNKQTAELLTFRFEFNAQKYNIHRRLDAVVKSITPGPINEEGDYLLEFECPTKDGRLISKVTAVPEKFGKHIVKIARSAVGENLGIIRHKQHFINEYNERTVKSPSFIYSETDVIIDDNGKARPSKAPYDKIRESQGHVVKIR